MLQPYLRRTNRLRLALVLAVPLLCVCTAARRQAQTTVVVGGGVAQGEHRLYGCGGEVIGRALHHVQAASVDVVHDTGGYLIGGASVAAQSDTVLSTTGTGDTIGRGANNLQSATVWVGMLTHESAADVGITVFSPLFVLPYASIRAGNFAGLYAEARLMSRRPLVDPNKLGFYGHWRSGRDRLGAGVGLISPTLVERSFKAPTKFPVPTAGSLQPPHLVSPDLHDLAIQLEGEFWLDATVGVAINWHAGTFGQLGVALLVQLPGDSKAARRTVSP